MFEAEVVAFQTSGMFFMWMLLGLAGLIFVEAWFPFRSDTPKAVMRWVRHIALYLIAVLLIGFLGVNASNYLQTSLSDEAWGLMPWVLSEASFGIQLIFFLVVYDVAGYAFHRLNHVWSPLWRLHVVHHSDTAIDATTPFRQHPLDHIVVAGYKLAVLFVLGATLPMLVLYELLQLLHGFWVHANASLPERLERKLRFLIITPGLHRTHHAAYQPETDSNFGVLFSVWDRLFGTYKVTSFQHQRQQRQGLEYFREYQDQSLMGILLQPLRYSRIVRPPPKSTTPSSFTDAES